LNIEGIVKEFIGLGERISQLPTNERQYYRRAVSETYRVLDNAVGLPIEKLTQIERIQDDITFVNEVRNLYSFTEWRNKEREVKLCEPLQEVAGELDAMVTKFKDKFAIRDRNELRNLIEQLRTERVGVAMLIRSSMESLSSTADEVDNSFEHYQKLRGDLKHKLKALDKIRQELTDSEIKFQDALSASSKKSRSI
jgi:cysteinyl-tRNA synthetase